MIHFNNRPYLDGTTLDVVEALDSISPEQKVRVYYGKHGVSFNLLHTGYLRVIDELLHLIPRPNAEKGDVLFTNQIMRIDRIMKQGAVKHYEVKGFTIGVVDSISTPQGFLIVVDGRKHGFFASVKEVNKYLDFLQGKTYKYKNKY